MVPKKQISRIFAAAGLMTTIAITPSSLNDSDPGASPDPDPEPADNNAVTLNEDIDYSEDLTQKRWKELLHFYSHPYDERKTLDFPDTDETVAVQIEIPFGMEGLFSTIKTPVDLLTRHGEAAAKITHETANKYGDESINTYFLNKPNSPSNWFTGPDNSYSKAIFENADIITVSMGYGSWGNQRNTESFGYVTDWTDLTASEQLWRDSDAIFVQSAGNNGDKVQGDIERNRWAALQVRADTYLPVGAAFKNYKGEIYTQAYTSPAGASFVVSNPFNDWFSYRYVRNEGEFRNLWDRYMDVVPEGENKTVRRLMLDKFENLLERFGFLGNISIFAFTGGNFIEQCHTAYDKASFDGKEILERDREWQRNNPKKMLNAYRECMIDSISYLNWEKFDAREDGTVTGIEGTSFSAPYFSGMAADMHNKYSGMTSYDLVAAALIAAQPFEGARDSENGIHNGHQYTDNGRGLPHNSYEAGFGYLERNNYDSVLATFQAMKEKGNAPSTEEKWIRSQRSTFDSDDGKLVENDAGERERVYSVQIDDDIVALSTMLAVNFVDPEGSDKQESDKQENAPASLTLVSPSGGQVEISPTNPADDDAISTAWQNGHFGNYTAGEWQVYVPENARIGGMELTIAGMKKGNVVDLYLSNFGGNIASPEDWREAFDIADRTAQNPENAGRSLGTRIGISNTPGPG